MDSKLLRVHAHRVPMTGISVSALGGALFSVISDDSNSGMFLAIQDVWQSFELFAGGPLVGANTFQATVT